MINKDFTLYPEALELKQLGFNEPTFFAFDNCSHPMRCTDLRTNEQKFNGVNYNSSSYTSQPTYSQAFRWFREKHNLKSWIQEHTSDTFIYEIRPHVLSDYKQGETYVYINYEEAELACLKKLIEIVKNGR